MGMSMVSMLAMEFAENLVDYHLTDGVVDVGDPKFWMAAAVSTAAGYLVPLLYSNYVPTFTEVWESLPLRIDVLQLLEMCINKNQFI